MAEREKLQDLVERLYRHVGYDVRIIAHAEADSEGRYVHISVQYRPWSSSGRTENLNHALTESGMIYNESSSYLRVERSGPLVSKELRIDLAVLGWETRLSADIGREVLQSLQATRDAL